MDWFNLFQNKLCWVSNTTANWAQSAFNIIKVQWNYYFLFLTSTHNKTVILDRNVFLWNSIYLSLTQHFSSFLHKRLSSQSVNSATNVKAWFGLFPLLNIGQNCHLFQRICNAKKFYWNSFKLFQPNLCCVPITTDFWTKRVYGKKIFNFEFSVLKPSLTAKQPKRTIF